MAHYIADVVDMERIRGYFNLCDIPQGSGSHEDYIRAKLVLVGLQNRGYVFDFGEAMREAGEWVEI